MGDTYVQISGTPRKTADAYRKINGVWQPSTELYTKIPSSGLVKQVFASEIVVRVTSNRQDLIMQNLFTTAQWQSSTKKRVIINSGVVLNGSGHEWAMAIQNGGQANPTWGGTLTVDNYGEILGRGGLANGGRGGHAIYPDESVSWSKKAIVNNYGNIRAGGGAGGRGGDGGGGYWVQANREGPRFNNNGGDPARGNLWRKEVQNWGNKNTRTTVSWDNSVFMDHWDTGTTDRSAESLSGYYFERGNYRVQSKGNESVVYWYEVFRTWYQNIYTSGGSGGNGGNGQGWQQGRTGGSEGTGGGANAGWGNWGGAGGDWGQSGGDGNKGVDGNNGAGAWGQAGGLSGIAYRTAIVTVNNYGAISGRIT